MIVVIDNYDSFVFNLVRFLRELGQEVRVYRNDVTTLEEVFRDSPESILISPGPGSPQGSNLSLKVIQEACVRRIPLLGVCLGHQAIAHVFGGTVQRAQVPMHGKVVPILHTQQGLFKGACLPLFVTRYHSLVVTSVPACFSITATSEQGEIMAISHHTLPIAGVQFHPEALLTQQGYLLLDNFLKGHIR